MLPGRFLGIARTTGDTFTFIIVQDKPKTGRVLHQSIIQKRNFKMNESYTDCTIPTPLVQNNSTECHSNIPPINNTKETIPLPPIDNYEEIIQEDIEDLDNPLSTCIVHVENEKVDHDKQLEIIYNHYNDDYKQTDIEDILQLKNHTDDGKLYSKVRWKTHQESLILADHIRSDDPSRLAIFTRDNPVERMRTSYWNMWAKNMIHDISNRKRKLWRMYRNISGKNLYYLHSRQTLRRQKKPFPLQMQSYLGVEIPRNLLEALNLDIKNEDNKWAEVMEKEINGIQEHGTFEFLTMDDEVPADYQLALL
jgi:hypothetical protein